MFKWLSTPMFILFVVSCAETVPPLTMLGKWHQVKSGDTLAKIASKYGVDRQALAELNQVADSGPIQGRDQIFIPLGKGKPPGDGKPPKEAPRSEREPTTQNTSIESGKAIVATTETQGSQCGREGRPCYLWPVDGSVVQWFGGTDSNTDRQSDGIDIQAERGADVVAAADGEVLYSGDAIKGYGNLLLVRHENNVISVYAHNERNTVKEGDKVKRGQKVAEVGDSGAAAQTMLHFEVRVSEQPVDPMLYLENKE